MIIGFDAKRAFCNERGLGNYSRNIIDQLLEFYPENKYVLFTPKTNAKITDKWQSYKRCEVIGPRNFFWKKAHPVWRSLKLNSEIKKNNIDLYHGLSHELPAGINKSKVKSIVTIHDLIYLRYPEYFPWIDRKVYHRKFSHSVKAADLVVAIGEQTKRDLVEFLKIPECKIVVHYQSCHESFYELLSEGVISNFLKKYNLNYKNYILNVGAFEERKNQKNLIRAYSLLLQQNPNLGIPLVLIGKGGSYIEQCKELVSELGITSHVLFLQNIEMDELPKLYQGACLFCFPSFFEGFGIPIIEALFSKVPVITSFGSCFPEVAGPSSWYIDPYKIGNIAEVMFEVLTANKGTLFDRVATSYKFVQKFHKMNTTKELIDIYRRVLFH